MSVFIFVFTYICNPTQKISARGPNGPLLFCSEMETISDKIEKWLAPKLEEIDAFLVDIKRNPALNRIEVYLDRETGIGLDACVEVSRFLEFHLDHEGDLGPNYILEVSSPGMDNPFKVLRQYKKYMGSKVEVLLVSGVKLEGLLVDVSEETLSVDEIVPSKSKNKSIPPELVRLEIPFIDIKATKRKFDF
jgi:ribosome maturation factor RimP